MTDYLSNGLQYIPAVVAPDNTYGIFFYGGGVKIVRAPFGGTQYEEMSFGASGGVTTLAAITVTAGGLTVTAGGLTVTAGGATVTAGGLTVTAGNVQITGGTVNIGSAASGALVMGSGNISTPKALGSTAGNALSFYFSTTATSGDTRGMYLRLYFGAAGGSGEALRAMTTVNGYSVAAGGTVNGAHITLGLTGAGATIAGQGFGLRVNYDVAASVTTVGGASNAVMLVESNIATGPMFHANTAFIRFSNLGAQKLANLFSITDPDTSAMFVNAGTGAGACGQANGSVCAKALKIIVGGTDYWIGLNSTNS